MILKNSILLIAVAGLGMVSSACSAKKSSADANTLQRVHFKFDDSSVTSEASSIVKQNAEKVKKASKAKVLVEGHADERGTNEYNIALGEKRAKNVAEQMKANGVSVSAVEIKSWGEEKPLDTAKSETAHSMNRRAEFQRLEGN